MAVGYVDFTKKYRGGGQGKGKRKGLYAGKAGAFAAQQNPQGFVNSNLQRAGLVTGTGPGAYENWMQEDFFNNIMAGYEGALSGNERLKFKNFFQSQTGAPNIGKKPKRMPSYDRFQQLRNFANSKYNALTPYQRGVTFSPYSAGLGRTAYWD